MTSPISGGIGDSGSRVFDMGELCNQLSRCVPLTQDAGRSLTGTAREEASAKLRGLIGQVLVDQEANQSKRPVYREAIGKVYGLASEAAKMGLIEEEVLDAVSIVAEKAGVKPQSLAFTLVAQDGKVEITNSDLLGKTCVFFDDMLKSGFSEAVSGRSTVFGEFPKATVEFILKCLQAPDSAQLELPKGADIDMVLQLIRAETEFGVEGLLPKLHKAMTDFVTQKDNFDSVAENSQEFLGRLQPVLNIYRSRLEGLQASAKSYEDDQKYPRFLSKEGVAALKKTRTQMEVVQDKIEASTPLVSAVVKAVFETNNMPGIINNETGGLEFPVSEFERFIEAHALFAEMGHPIPGLPVSVVIEDLKDLEIFIGKYKEVQSLGTPIDKLKISCSHIYPKEALARLEAAGITNVEIVAMRYGPKVPRGTSVIGPLEWNVFLGDVGEFAPFRSPEGFDLVTYLEAEDPLNPGKKRKETQTLMYMPKTVGGVPMTLNNFLELAQSRNPENPLVTKYDWWIKEKIGDDPPDESHWILVSNDSIKDSKYASVAQQHKLLEADPSYTLPGVADATKLIIMEVLKTGKTAFNRSKRTHIRCQVKNGQEPYVGGFDYGKGVRIDRVDKNPSMTEWNATSASSGFSNTDDIGIVGVRKFA